MADSYNCILQILEYQGEATAEAGTDGNTIVITGHGLGGGDFIVNTTRRATSQSSAERGSRKVTFTDVNTLEVVGADITGMTEGDTIRLYSFIDRTAYLRAGSLSITKRAGGENEASFQIKSTYTAPSAVAYIVFGIGESTTYLKNCDAYSPTGNSWTSKTDGVDPARYSLSSTTILNLLYSFAGLTSTNSSDRINDCDEYNPSSNSWESKTNITTAIYEFSSSTISDKGYTYGGIGGLVAIPRNYTYEYNSTSNSWATKTNLPSPERARMAASTISDKGYVYAGFYTNYLKDCDEFNVSSNSWSNKTDATTATDYLSASTINDKGYIYAGRLTARECSEYNPTSNSWASKATMPLPSRSSLGASTITNKGYVYGGTAAAKILDCDEYNPSSDRWESKSDMPNPARSSHGASTI
jgi:N-acetylneuraminic acid mutarotase